ncbi:hypothetical protein SCHPADRAFT_911302 [Schizopora paradoxa]|uniref:Uncharacterized protein n=1 Tax=Schizopora paradoxa TaxID=27342 RepID=A0A0H2R026_9AGAM|nr:hypothetical protein SCHPADRAFT_911302 [Schizopora paradoxa]
MRFPWTLRRVLRRYNFVSARLLCSVDPGTEAREPTIFERDIRERFGSFCSKPCSSRRIATGDWEAVRCPTSSREFRFRSSEDEGILWRQVTSHAF